MKLYERWNVTNTVAGSGVGSTDWKAMLFNVGATGPEQDHHICGVKLYLTRPLLATGIDKITVHIRNAFEATGPYGADICNASIDPSIIPSTFNIYYWITILVPAKKILHDTWYAIILSLTIKPGADPDDNAILWGQDVVYPFYESGSQCYWMSNNNGVTWTSGIPSSLYFEEWGYVTDRICFCDIKNKFDLKIVHPEDSCLCKGRS